VMAENATTVTSATHAVSASVVTPVTAEDAKA